MRGRVERGTQAGERPSGSGGRVAGCRPPRLRAPAPFLVRLRARAPPRSRSRWKPRSSAARTAVSRGATGSPAPPGALRIAIDRLARRDRRPGWSVEAEPTGPGRASSLDLAAPRHAAGLQDPEVHGADGPLTPARVARPLKRPRILAAVPFPTRSARRRRSLLPARLRTRRAPCGAPGCSAPSGPPTVGAAVLRTKAPHDPVTEGVFKMLGTVGEYAAVWMRSGLPGLLRTRRGGGCWATAPRPSSSTTRSRCDRPRAPARGTPPLAARRRSSRSPPLTRPHRSPRPRRSRGSSPNCVLALRAGGGSASRARTSACTTRRRPRGRHARHADRRARAGVESARSRSGCRTS